MTLSKKSLSLMLCLFWLSGRGVFGQEALYQYLETAAGNNPALKARFHEYLASLEVIDQVKGLPDPLVSFGYFIRPVQTRVGPQNARISLTQMFPWFGTLHARGNTAVRMAKAKFEHFEEARSKLFFDVKSAFYELYYTERTISSTRENIAILNTHKKLASVMTESGTASLVDVIRADMELAEMENMLSALEDKNAVQRIAFNTLLNRGQDEPVDIPANLWDPGLTIPKPALLDSIRLNNHQLRNAAWVAEYYGARKDAARLSGMPSFTVGMDYLFMGRSDNPMLEEGASGRDAIVFPMIGMTLPIYRKKVNAMTREAQQMRDSAESEKTDKENQLEVLFENSYRNYLDADRRIRLFSKQKDYADRALRILESDYSTGGKNFEDLLQMEKRWLHYSLNLERARTDKQTAIAFIDFLMGN